MNNQLSAYQNAVDNVLCCWIKHSTTLPSEYLELLTPQLFKDQRHKDITEAIHFLYKKGNIDSQLILYWLKDNNKLHNSIEEYVLQLSSKPLALFRYKQDILFLKKVAKKRKADSIVKQLHTSQNSLDTWISYTKELTIVLNEIKEDAQEEDNFIDSEKAVESWYKTVEELKKNPPIPIRTHYPQLDSKLRYLKLGSLITIGARPGVGKTTFAINLIHNNLKLAKKTETIEIPAPYDPKPGVIYKNETVFKEVPKEDIVFGIGLVSLEIDTHDAITTLAALKGGTQITLARDLALLGKKVETAEYVQETSLSLKNYNLGFLDYFQTSNLYCICEWIRGAVKKRKFKIIIIDHIQLITTTPKAGQYEKVSECTRTLKLLALELKIVIIVLSQLNRNIENRGSNSKEPQLSDLRDSGTIEQDSDVVMFLDKPPKEKDEEPEENARRIYVCKNRWGPQGEIDFDFNWEKAKFREINTQQTQYHKVPL